MDTNLPNLRFCQRGWRCRIGKGRRIFHVQGGCHCFFCRRAFLTFSTLSPYIRRRQITPNDSSLTHALFFFLSSSTKLPRTPPPPPCLDQDCTYYHTHHHSSNPHHYPTYHHPDPHHTITYHHHMWYFPPWRVIWRVLRRDRIVKRTWRRDIYL